MTTTISSQVDQSLTWLTASWFVGKLSGYYVTWKASTQVVYQADDERTCFVRIFVNLSCVLPFATQSTCHKWRVEHFTEIDQYPLLLPSISLKRHFPKYRVV